MKITEQFWKHAEPIYQAILKHPFIRELADGSLREEIFIFYMKQDALYLIDFSRALALTGLRSMELRHFSTFLRFALDAVNVERGLHDTFFKRYGVELDVESSPACFAYTHFLLSTASLRSAEESMAALLPCFWIYREVGLYILERTKPGNPYQDWIDMYAGEEFNASVEAAIGIVEEVGSKAHPSVQKEMLAAFTRSSRLEWIFWESAYRRERWQPDTSAGATP